MPRKNVPSPIPFDLVPGGQTFYREIHLPLQFSGSVRGLTPEKVFQGLDLSIPGHSPTLTVNRVDNYGQVTLAKLSCSCGFSIDATYVTTAGTVSKTHYTSFVEHMVGSTRRKSTKAHAQGTSIAAPVLVWTSKAPRTVYKCNVAMTAQVNAMGGVPKRLPKTKDFHVVVSSSNGSIVLKGSYRTFNEAFDNAKREGYIEGKRNKVTWSESVPIISPSSKAADILVALDNSKGDLAMMMEAIKLADEFISTAELVSEKKAELMREFREQIDII